MQIIYSVVMTVGLLARSAAPKSCSRAIGLDLRTLLFGTPTWIQNAGFTWL